MSNIKNKSLDLQGELQELVTTKMFNNLADILFQLPHKALCLDDKNNDAVYAYAYGVDDQLLELQVKGVVLAEDDRIMVRLDTNDIQYQLEDLLDDYETLDDQWYDLMNGELLSWFTLININEVLHEYL